MPTSIKTFINNTIPSIIGRHSIWIPGYALSPALVDGAAPNSFETATSNVTIRTLDFDATTQEFAQFTIQMPKAWDEGTLTAQTAWSHTTTATNFGVAWAIQAYAFADGDTLDPAGWGTEVVFTDTGGTANTLYITANSTPFTVGGTPGPEEVVVFRIKRVPANASDTLAVDARLHGVKIQYTIDAATDA